MPKTQERKVLMPALQMRADFQPETVNEEKRTVEVTWTTGAKVKRSSWWDGVYMEALSLKKEHVRMDFLNSGKAPLLGVHRQYDLNDVVGVVEKAWLTPKEGRALVRFSDRESVKEIWQDVKNGILRGISVGYLVHRYEKMPEADGEDVPTWEAVDWEPKEISLVPIGADSGAEVRSHGNMGSECVFINRIAERGEKEKQMPEIENPTPAVQKPVTVDVEAAKREAGQASTHRATEILSACRKASLPVEFAEGLIANEKMDLSAARGAIIDEVAKRSAEQPETRGQIRVEAGAQDEKQTRRESAAIAIAHRYHGDKVPMTDGARLYRHMSLLDLARSVVRSQGVNPDFMGRTELVGRAFSTSDFPNILLDAANKSMLMGYKEAPATFDSFVRRASFSDFKTHNRVALGDAPDLEVVNQGGEIKQGSMSDRKEAYALATYAKKMAITRQTIINDDLDALTKVPASWGMRARQKEADLVYAQITSNPTMGDSVALFHATHSNLQSATAFAETPLAVMRAAMRKQKSLDNAKIDLRPVSILVPVALETSAENVTTKLYAPTKGADQAAWLRGLNVIAEPRLDDNSATAYYVLAGKDQCDIIELATLEGQGPMIETKEGWDVLGSEMRIIYDLAAKVLDFRGLQKNAGA